MSATVPRVAYASTPPASDIMNQILESLRTLASALAAPRQNQIAVRNMSCGQRRRPPPGRIRCYICGGRHIKVNCKSFGARSHPDRSDRDEHWRAGSRCRTPESVTPPKEPNSTPSALELAVSESAQNSADGVECSGAHLIQTRGVPSRPQSRDTLQTAAELMSDECAQTAIVPVRETLPHDAEVKIYTVDEILAIDPSLRRYWAPPVAKHHLVIPVPSARCLPSYQAKGADDDVPSAFIGYSTIHTTRHGQNQKCPAVANQPHTGIGLAFAAVLLVIGYSLSAIFSLPSY